MTNVIIITERSLGCRSVIFLFSLTEMAFDISFLGVFVKLSLVYFNESHPGWRFIIARRLWLQLLVR